MSSLRKSTPAGLTWSQRAGSVGWSGKIVQKNCHGNVAKRLDDWTVAAKLPPTAADEGHQVGDC